MSLRHFVLGALLGFIVAVGPSCGTPNGKPACKPSNCGGCCDKSGDCQPGDQALNCGTRANGCVECTQDQSCSKIANSTGGECAGTGGGSGSGTGGGTSCSATCQGCCTSDEVCRGGNTNQTCGKMGAACVACAASEACQMAACGAVPCTTGCKTSAGACLAGNADTACGSAGASCTSCAMGLACSNGACIAACNSTTCASGCCDGSTCVTPPTALKCGLTGGACQSCTSSTSCVAGACQAGTGGGAGGGAVPTFCDSTNCLGCCKGITCMAGTAHANCGIQGEACKACSAIQVCFLQVCFP